MKTIRVRVSIEDAKETAEITLEKKAEGDEIDVLASGISTLFIKSKTARNLAEKRPHERIEIVGRPVRRKR